MANHDPETLRLRADRYQRIAQRMNDQQAVQALQTLAGDYISQADEAEAKQHRIDSQAVSS